MKFKLFLSAFLLLSFTSWSQINMADSSVQVIGYWDKNEQQSYLVTEDIIRLKDADTLYKEHMKYKIEIKILDSASNSYTIEWVYKDFETNIKPRIKKQLAAISHNKRVVLMTDEMGAFKEVLNGQELTSQMNKSLKDLRQVYKITPEENELIKRFELTFANKESLENSFVNDIQQFYTFHGGKYTLNEPLEAHTKVQNVLGGDPFDSYMQGSLDEIDDEDNTFILRLSQDLDSKQLTDATFEYLVAAANRMGSTVPKRDELKDLTNELLISARIHGSGWIIYSVSTKTVSAESTTNIEERVVELE